MTSVDEKEYFHISKKKRNAPNALNKKRKNLALYDNIVDFDYDTLKTIEQEEEEEFEKHKQEQKPWSTLVGRVRSIERVYTREFSILCQKNGAKRMGKLLEKTKIAMNNMDLNAMIEDIANIARILTNPG